MKQIVAAVKEQGSVTWGYKTYHTYLRNMCEKGLITSEERNLKDKLYSAAVSREEAMKAESDSIVTRSNYFGSAGLARSTSNAISKETLRLYQNRCGRNWPTTKSGLASNGRGISHGRLFIKAVRHIFAQICF